MTQMNATHIATLDGMPHDVRGSYAYDPLTTSWELRGSVWTPTPAMEQAVGEAFEGYVSFSARDNGTSRLRGAGGVSLLRCLNASTYTANGSDVSRVHRGSILVDVLAMLKGGLKAIDALCTAWGVARNAEIVNEALAGLPVSQAIQGLWWGELSDRRSELAGVLPGRSAEHVKKLSLAYADERRNQNQIVRADMAQAWTRYIQDQPTAIRREAESAIADWIVNPSPVRFDSRTLVE